MTDAALTVETSSLKLADVAALVPRVASELAEDVVDVSDSASTCCMLGAVDEESCGSDMEITKLKPQGIEVPTTDVTEATASVAQVATVFSTKVKIPMVFRIETRTSTACV